MIIKNIVDSLLKEKNRPMNWLATEMGKTFDGLKLSLIKGSIKYNDIIVMAKILEVPPDMFFQTEPISNTNTDVQEAEGACAVLKNRLKNCKEMLAILKDQIKDKDKIIYLLSKKN